MAKLPLKEQPEKKLRKQKRSTSSRLIMALAATGTALGLTLSWTGMAYTLFFIIPMKLRTSGSDYLFYDAIWYLHLPPTLICLALLSVHLPEWLIGWWNSSRGPGFIEREESSGLWKFTLLFGVLALPFMLLDVMNYTLVTEEGVRKRGYASFTPANYSWNQVEQVETGCYYDFSRIGGGQKLAYEVVFRDHTRVNLFDGRANGIRLDNIALVDGALKELNVGFDVKLINSGLNNGSYSVNDACFKRLAQNRPDDYEEIVKLLRLQAYAADALVKR